MVWSDAGSHGLLTVGHRRPQNSLKMRIVLFVYFSDEQKVEHSVVTARVLAFRSISSNTEATALLNFTFTFFSFDFYFTAQQFISSFYLSSCIFHSSIIRLFYTYFYPLPYFLLYFT